MQPIVLEIFISPEKGVSMQPVQEALAHKGKGLEGDRYASPEGGSWNAGKPGKRQVTLIDIASFEGTGFTPSESRRNIVTKGINLMNLLGNPDAHTDLYIGDAIFRVVKYCDPCARPGNLCNKESFKELFSPDRGGIIKVGDDITVGMKPAKK